MSTIQIVDASRKHASIIYRFDFLLQTALFFAIPNKKLKIAPIGYYTREFYLRYGGENSNIGDLRCHHLNTMVFTTSKQRDDDKI
ncbi:MAG: hypothetical protein IKM95_06090 [Bacteroidales bacterium]|nr:hypothetical protein [Bacteroidales bacterium]